MSVTPRIGYAPRSDGGHIGYSVLGEGPPMIIWPGGTLSAACMWEEPRCARAQRQLATFTTWIAMDRRGIGFSDPLGPGQTPTIELQANDVLAVMDHLGIEKAILSANGWDGQAMVLLAATRPDRVEKLILQSFTPCPASGPDWPQGVALDLINAVLDELASPGDGRRPQDIISLMAPSQAGDQDLRRWFEEAGRVGPSTANAYVGTTLGFDVRPLLAQIEVPVLILHAARDRWTPVEGARYCAEQIPHARLIEFDSADHIFFTDYLDPWLAAVEEFIEGDLYANEQRQLSTVLFTDIVGSTEQLSASDDKRWSAILDEVDSTVERQVRRHQGRVCKSTGDGHLALFERPSDAVGAALALTRDLALLGTPIRAGIHFGEIEIRGGDVAGVAVHVCARVSSKAGASEILVTRTVADLIAGSGYRTEEAGDHELKGLPGTWPLFRVAIGR